MSIRRRPGLTTQCYYFCLEMRFCFDATLPGGYMSALVTIIK